MQSQLFASALRAGQAHKNSKMLDMLSTFDIGRDPLPDWMLWAGILECESGFGEKRALDSDSSIF